MSPSTLPAPAPGAASGCPPQIRRISPVPRVLRYPANSLVLVAGIPGAGKSTMLNRLFGMTGRESATVRTRAGVRVVDSQQSRNRLHPLLSAVHYPLWRPLMHLLHYLRILAALRRGGPVVVHESGTRGPVRRLLGWYCRRRGVEVHLLLIDSDPGDALRGQIQRGRQVAPRSHRTHVRRWRRLLAACPAGPGAVVPGARSLLLLDRGRAGDLAEIRFTPGPALPAPGGAAAGAVP
ncbi:ATP-binding protein [Streptomonospora sp. S1-112]|uniref:ATP-binding protein n=1 Tax=Streptomonospora mangrovi TaxID=2883123 RepID=A0A9X3NQU5_9ACTN|nr:AAA family ATPase [Streptomonospora mangrovi]MDA0566581.1 ATP-binding protein [Streptomonospora mangrovi]